MKNAVFSQKITLTSATWTFGLGVENKKNMTSWVVEGFVKITKSK